MRQEAHRRVDHSQHQRRSQIPHVELFDQKPQYCTVQDEQPDVHRHVANEPGSTPAIRAKCIPSVEQKPERAGHDERGNVRDEVMYSSEFVQRGEYGET